MKINLLKYCDNKWIVIPPRNTVQEILDIINKYSIKTLENLLESNLIDDKNNKPDILKATEISLRYCETSEIDFELFEYF